MYDCWLVIYLYTISKFTKRIFWGDGEIETSIINGDFDNILLIASANNTCFKITPLPGALNYSIWLHMGIGISRTITFYFFRHWAIKNSLKLYAIGVNSNK